MGYNSKVRKLIDKRKEMNDLSIKMHDYLNNLKLGFKQGNFNIKLLTNRVVEKDLTRALGEIQYKNLVLMANDIIKLLINNSYEWKKTVIEYVNGWLFIQKQILNSLLYSFDITKQMLSLSLICQSIMQPHERLLAIGEMHKLQIILINNFIKLIGPNGKELFTDKSYLHTEGFINYNNKRVGLTGNVNLVYTSTDSSDKYRVNLINYKDVLLNWLYYGPNSDKLTGKYSKFTFSAQDNSIENNDNTLTHISDNWCDVTTSVNAYRTTFILNGDIEKSKISGSSSYQCWEWEYSGYTTISNGTQKEFTNKNILKSNILTSISKCINAQQDYIIYNEKQLESSMDSKKINYLKAEEVEKEIENIIESSISILEDRANLYSLLAVSEATKLI